jgi:integrase/recombinase XerD
MSSRGIALGLKRAANRHGIDSDVVYPHSFRHLFAKNFVARNPDIALLADLMGHESIETTRIYLRRSASEQRDAVDMAIDW